MGPDQSPRNLNAELHKLDEVVTKIVNELREMYRRSSANEYYTFRTFMMGTKGTQMFPKGVIYGGIGRDQEYQQYRGASAAMDMTMPLIDSFLGISERFPKNSLSELLMDYRPYMPKEHVEFVDSIL